MQINHDATQQDNQQQQHTHTKKNNNETCLIYNLSFITININNGRKPAGES